MRSLFRNFTFKNALGRLTLISESPLDTSNSSAEAYRVDISLSRPWKVKAGEWINLTLPKVGFLYTCQAHPFTVAWWEEDETGYASSISLLIKKDQGSLENTSDRTLNTRHGLMGRMDLQEQTVRSYEKVTNLSQRKYHQGNDSNKAKTREQEEERKLIKEFDDGPPTQNPETKKKHYRT
ncbi:hypothetical protein ACJ73_01604 [Blastomyces percursus]|uniref:FAD-binding 8 domain-containing protein n=1 Tax=Blastomyces percursus TaxID=1658174 RepID=A0A1J9REJ9_9EURO|nr:hypothetical protein ACJ73_01604 [Blastomyces percursus]